MALSLLLEDAEVLPLWICGKSKLYLSTSRRRSSTPLLRYGEALYSRTGYSWFT